jgi:hypothetical protein
MGDWLRLLSRRVRLRGTRRRAIAPSWIRTRLCGGFFFFANHRSCELVSGAIVCLPKHIWICRAIAVKCFGRSMSRTSLLFHSTLAPNNVGDTLRRSIEPEGVPRYLLPWFIRLFRKLDSPGVCGVVGSNTFRIRRQDGGQHSPNLYAKWEPEYSGIIIEAHFDLAPIVRLSLRITVVVVLGLAVLGILLNLLDLTVGTHFTKDPSFGLVLSIMLVPFDVGCYLLARRLGSRRDETLLVFLERTLAASRVR